ncbi:MAG: hypothetical protein NVSMB12_11450 [Acidimicrobiales bacterium]
MAEDDPADKQSGRPFTPIGAVPDKPGMRRKAPKGGRRLVCIEMRKDETAGTQGNTLIVDDEEDMRLLLRFTIERANQGLRVIQEAASGEEALAIRDGLDVNVIVMDHRMPGLTGVETAKALLASEPDLPIVLYSAFVDDELAAEAHRVGIRRCVKKGDVRNLISTLHELTGTG